MAVPQRVVLYLHSRICFMACTGITDFHVRAWRSGYRIPVGASFSAPAQNDPGAHPVSYTMGTGGKAAGAWRLPPTPSSAEVKEGVEL